VNSLRLYAQFLSVYFKSLMEYRFSFFMDIFIQFTTYGSTYMGIWIVLTRFESIGGWSLYEVLFLYTFNLLSYGICSLFVWSPMRQLEWMVQRGEFDGVLVKPMNPLVHLIFRQFNQHFLGHILLSCIVFAICFRHLDIVWNAANICYFVLALAGATAIQAALLIISGSMSFWFVKSNSFTDTMIYSFRGFLDYPISIYSKWIQIFLTFVIPYAFVNYFPSQYFLGKEGSDLFHPFFRFGTPVIGALLMMLALFVWRKGIDRYQGTGS